MTQTIPDVVLARIDLHRADASHRAAKLDADLRTRVLGASLSARLRKARDQARAEAEAWAILLTYRPDTAKVCPACGRTMEDCTCKGGRACPVNGCGPEYCPGGVSCAGQNRGAGE